MAVNPMQRKANNSFLIGVVVTLLITGLIIAVLLMQLSKIKKEIAAQEAQIVYGYVIIEDVKSGTEIEAHHVQGVEIGAGVQSDIVYSSKTKDIEGNNTADQTGALLPTGLKAKVDLHAGTVLTSDLTYEDELVAADVRKQEYNVIEIPSQLQSGEYIDVRLRLPNGQDLIVVSHKEVEIPTIAGVDSEKCIWIQLDELEILNMSSAIVETYRMNGAKLYATRYVEAGMQESAQITYLPSDEVIALMNKDPNIVQEAKNKLFTRYNDNSQKNVIRNPINSLKNHEDAEDNLTERVDAEIESLQEEREKYLESLGM